MIKRYERVVKQKKKLSEVKQMNTNSIRRRRLEKVGVNKIHETKTVAANCYFVDVKNM